MQNNSLYHGAEPEATCNAQSSVSAHRECIVQVSSSSDKPIHFDSHTGDFVESEEEKSERKSGLDFFSVLFVGFLIDYLFSEANLHTVFPGYSGFIPLGNSAGN